MQSRPSKRIIVTITQLSNQILIGVAHDLALIGSVRRHKDSHPRTGRLVAESVVPFDGDIAAADGVHHCVGAVHGGGSVGDGGKEDVEGDEVHFVGLVGWFVVRVEEAGYAEASRACLGEDIGREEEIDRSG